jgi:hypothetical protein
MLMLDQCCLAMVLIGWTECERWMDRRQGLHKLRFARGFFMPCLGMMGSTSLWSVHP